MASKDCEGVETSGQELGDWLDVALKTLKADEITREDELTFVREAEGW